MTDDARVQAIRDELDRTLGMTIADADWLLDHLQAAEARAASAEQECDAVKPPDISVDECSAAVFVIRMVRSGYSYDAVAGIWWRDNDKPGIVQTLEQQLAAAEAVSRRLQEAIRTVVETFQRDEAQGYCSRDRQFALDVLGAALLTGDVE